MMTNKLIDDQQDESNSLHWTLAVNFHIFSSTLGAPVGATCINVYIVYYTITTIFKNRQE